ncbi:MAG TPA: hypothetical protein VF941_20555 [Clostridia bacterium]
MALTFNIGECPICRGYGLLEILYNFDENSCSIMCDNCLTEWNKPEDALKNFNGFRKSYQKVEARGATREDIEEVGWEKYVVNWLNI